jgi:hypothetical protein
MKLFATALTAENNMMIQNNAFQVPGEIVCCRLMTAR